MEDQEIETELLLTESVSNDIIDYSSYFETLQAYSLLIIGLLTLILLTKWFGGK